MSPAVLAAFLDHRGQALLPAPRRSTGFGSSARSRPTSSACRVREGFSTITMQLARQSLSRGHQPAASGRSAASSARPTSPWRSRPSTPRTRSSSSTSTRSTWAIARSGWRPPRSAISASRRSELNVAEAATLAALPKAPSGTTPAGTRTCAVQRRNLILAAAGQRHSSPGRRQNAGRRTRSCSSSRADFSGVAATSSSTSASSSTRASVRPLHGRPPGLHHARSRHPAGRRAGARGAARGDRERAAYGALPPPDLSRSTSSRSAETPDDETSRTHDALPAGLVGDAGGQDRQHPRHGRRAGLRRHQVQPGDPGAPAARLDLQAVRLRRGGPGRRTRCRP